jgi:HlyD family secretion protein
MKVLGPLLCPPVPSPYRWLVPLCALLLVGTAACGGQDADGPAEATALPPIQASAAVVSDGVVVPVEHVTLAFAQGGRVARLPIEVGEEVKLGQIVARLDPGAAAADVLRAEADLSAAELALEEIVRGATAEELAAAEAAVDAARAGVSSAAGSLASSGASRDRVVSGASAEEIAVAERQVAAARNMLWGAQSRRDSICGRVEKKLADVADCDLTEAEIGRLWEETRIAQIRLDDLRAGARAEDLRAAQGQVASAAGQRDAAQARLREAQARLDQVRNGANAAEIGAAKARIDGARAALESARVRMEDTVIRAPFGGVIANITAREQEFITPGAPVIRIADTDAWLIETDDLSELGVVQIAIGDPARIELDALPDVELPGRVIAIDGFGVNVLGDITYKVTIEPEESDPRMRWNMTASVTIEGSADGEKAARLIER